MKNLFSVSVCFLLAFICSAQQTNIKFSHLSLKDGLSQSEVLTILQDDKGLMWFGTQDGLNQYNGFEFKVFSSDITDSTTISNSFIHQVYQDSSGLIWVATENGLNIYNRDQQTFKNIIANNTLSKSKNNVWSIDEDAKYIWAGIENQLIKIDKSTHTVKSIPISLSTNAKSLKIRKIKFIEETTLFIGTEGNGVIKFKTTDNSSTHFYTENSGLNSNTIADFYKHTDNQIWIATNRGICIYNSKSEKIIKHAILNSRINNANVTTIFEDKSGIIWIGTENDGLYKFKFLENVDHYAYNATIGTSLSSNKISTIYEDNTGIIWIGTQSGVDKFDKQKQYFKHYQHWPNTSHTINSNMVWCIFQDDSFKSTLWVGTNMGVNIFDKETGEMTSIAPDFSKSNVQRNNGIYSVYKDHKGTIYLGSDGGIFIYSEGNLVPVKYSNGENRSRTYTIKEDKQHRLWLGTKEGLVVVSADRKTFKLYTSSNQEYSLKSDIVRSVVEDKNGNIWLGTDGGGLVKVIEEKDSIYFKSYVNNPAYLNSLSQNGVLVVAEGKNDNLWIGTFGGGLNKFNTKTEEFTRFTEKDGLSNNVIYGIIADDRNYLWLSTNKGVSAFNLETKTFYNYEESDGLQSNEFNTGAYYKNSLGEIFFGGVNGYNSFYPEDVHKNKSLPKPLITNFYLFNKPVSIGPNSILKKQISELEEITLKYKENVISFEFASLHYAYPLKNQHAYMLENFNEDWVYIGNNRIANYTNLDPGEYIFKVKVANSDGVWNEEPAQIRVIVLPPIWATWWFRSIGILIILAIIYAYYITKINRVKAQKLLLEVQVRERTYEVIKQKEEIESQKQLIEIEKEKAEKLLLNILPEETVEELKAKGKATARQYRLASIMFTDFKSFTKIAEKIDPQDLVAELDRYFIKFDEIIEKYDIEKIKTIGDSYMCAGGIPIRNKSNPIDIVLAGLEIQRFVAQDHTEKEAVGEKSWGLRIGIHTGEIIAGVVGIKRFAYDIWGDSVNIASRVEAASGVGMVNISGATYNLVKEFFECEYRGKIKAKNKGHIDMYFVHRIRKELSVNGEGNEPNELFQKYVDLHIYSGINYRKAERYIVNRLEKELPNNLHYHDLRHTLDVCAAVERIALMEGVEGDDIFLLKTAALYHDAGFVKQYSNNEEIGAALAKEVLPRFGYTDEQIEVIHQLIKATKVPQQPKNKLEEIICDADLDYLGGNDFHLIADKLKRELMERDIVQTDKQWDELQIKFLEQHRYFTKTAIELRRDNKKARIEEVKERLKTYKD
ncbi:MAG: HD domain-containing protein [Flavobacteriales bacterium]|nr:HD domain-containing protein [Flavobacteriales bacterium]MCB9364443.1 HD domain-containing protein [Flavobacteriales bacterium]